MDDIYIQPPQYFEPLYPKSSIDTNTKEGMSNMAQTMSNDIKQFTDTVSSVSSQIATTTENTTAQAIDTLCYKIVDNTDTKYESPSNRHSDQNLLKHSILILILTPLCVFAFYNWYYLLFYEYSKIDKNDMSDFYENLLKNQSPTVKHFIYLFKFLLSPLSILTNGLFSYPDKIKKNVFKLNDTERLFPFQSILCFVLLIILIKTFNFIFDTSSIATMLRPFCIAIICFMWALFVFNDATNNPWFAIPTVWTILLAILYYAGMLGINVTPYAITISIYTIIGYLLFLSVYGIAKYESITNVFTVIGQMMKNIKRTDDSFIKKMQNENAWGIFTPLLSFLDMFNWLLTDNILCVTYILLFLSMIGTVAWKMHSERLKTYISAVLGGAIVVLLSIIVLGMKLNNPTPSDIPVVINNLSKLASMAL